MGLGILIELLLWSLLGFKSKSKKPIRIPVTHVDHAADDAWQFYSGNYQTKIKFVNFYEAEEADATIKELNNLPVGHSAKRDIKDSLWIRFDKAKEDKPPPY